MKITTWNVNSINARLDHLLDFIKKNQSDLILLQEEQNPHALSSFEFWQFNKAASSIACASLPIPCLPCKSIACGIDLVL